MSTLDEKIMTDIKDAMRAKDQTALSALRALKSAIKYAAIEKGGTDAELDETEALSVIRKQIKQRQDSVASYEAAQRPELADKEKAEIEILNGYLPAPLSAEELDKLVDTAIAEAGATSRADMGKVMKALQQSTEGRADGKALSQAVMKRLS